ncbi:MAG: hypothetical protein EPN45_08785 [Rhizobiaceae bacterium]|nr:MAG: hypothetical protein EPN45_08785 [Rhizobiaceae bacterium]
MLVWVIGIGFALLLFAASPRHAIAAALVVTLSLSAVYLYFRYLSQVEAENRRNLITDITYDPGKCPDDAPLYFLFKNLSNRSVESISFQIKAYQNHSNELKSGGVHTLSKLIAPSQIYTSCLPLPSDISTTAELDTLRWTTSIFLVIWR